MIDLDPDHVTFKKQVVSDDADHDYGFWASYTYDDETGRVHTIERQFEIYSDSDHQTNDPVAVIEETHLVAQEPREERRAGDAEQVDKSVRELVVDVDDSRYEESAVMQWCEDWHEAHLERPAE